MGSKEESVCSPRVKLRWKEKKDGDNTSNLLIGKVMAAKPVNKRSIIATIRKGWNLGESTSVVEMRKDCFVFSFRSLANKRRILRGRPWTIQGLVMSIQEWLEFMVLSEVNFDRIPYWVQFHNIPLGILEFDENVKVMGQEVGEVVWLEKAKVRHKFIRSFGRARILIDCNKPLCYGFWVPRPDGSEVWVDVKYERLQAFCYKCGTLAHDGRLCIGELVLNDQGEHAYSPWMAALVERDMDEALVKVCDFWCEEDGRPIVGFKEDW